VSTNEDTLRSLGKLLEAGQGARDAVHIAVAPVVAGEQMAPGSWAKLNEEGEAVRTPGPLFAVGIVDPFLDTGPQAKQRCWLYLMPGSITSLRHDWAHPAFPVMKISVATGVDAEAAKSELWLREFAENHGVGYSELVRAAESGDTSAVCFTTTDTWAAQQPDFWEHVENVTGKRFTEDHRENTYFSCSC
jgi:hypothetical protein